jgi:hypothetical protein
LRPPVKSYKVTGTFRSEVPVTFWLTLLRCCRV